MKNPNDAGIFRMEINPIGKNSLTDQIEAFLCQIFKKSNQNYNCVVRERVKNCECKLQIKINPILMLVNCY